MGRTRCIWIHQSATLRYFLVKARLEDLKLDVPEEPEPPLTMSGEAAVMREYLDSREVELIHE